MKQKLLFWGSDIMWHLIVGLKEMYQTALFFAEIKERPQVLAEIHMCPLFGIN